MNPVNSVILSNDKIDVIWYAKEARVNDNHDNGTTR